jgi:hypothetical protein
MVQGIQIYLERGKFTMVSKEENYAAIAEKLRNQPIPEIPIKHEWLELLAKLSDHEDPKMREAGLKELLKCTEYSTRKSKV